jgi:hypothetical protein
VYTKIGFHFVVTLFTASSLRAADPSDGWENLRHITKDHMYTLVLRGGKCQPLTIASSDRAQLVIDQVSSKVSVQRRDVLLVSDSDERPVFSARSSWLDVKKSFVGPGEFLQISTRTGQELRWGHAVVQDNDISQAGKSVSKDTILRIVYVRHKPLTRAQQALDQVPPLHENSTSGDATWRSQRDFRGILSVGPSPRKTRRLAWNAF